MFEPLIAASVITLISFVGVFFFREKTYTSELNHIFLPLSVGMFLAVTLFELIPEALHESEHAPYAIAAGFFGFLLLSRVVREYHHHHDHGCDNPNERTRGSLVLVGDAVHNFADGIVIATSFVLHPMLGIATTAGIALHEIPQEIAEYGILRNAGYSAQRALVLNFLSAISVIGGALGGIFFLEMFGSLLWILLGIAAGNLLYIAASDILPSLTETHTTKKDFAVQFSLSLLGLLLIGGLLYFAHPSHMEETHEMQERGF